MSWTDERVAKLKELWTEGMSASQIAKVLGGVSRNAVIGKVHRLGLSNRASPAATGGTGGGATASDASPTPETANNSAAASAAGTEPNAAKSSPKAQTPPVEEPAPAENAVEVRRPPVIRDASQPRAPGLPTPEEEAARATLAKIEKIARNISLLELTERTCKWPIGDPTDDDFSFCGLSAMPGKPYCEHHVGVAFQTMSTRRDRSRTSR